MTSRALVFLASGSLLAMVGMIASGSGAEAPLTFEGAELRQILSHGPWPPALPRDGSNRASGVAAAMSLGERLFFEPRMSASGTVSCASCHVPDRAWSDGLPRARGVEELDRNTPSLWNVGGQRWFGWGGAGDSLWSQSIRPVLDRREMGATASHVAALVRSTPAIACEYEAAFGAGSLSGRSDEAVLVDAGKAIAAFLETLVSDRTPFDDFRDALASGDRAAAAGYPLAAQRGLRLFVGGGRCHVCHFGPNFANGEFHDVGVPFFVGRGRVDAGRHEGIRTLRASPFNLLGRHSDDVSGEAAMKTRHLELQHRNWGEFKVPSLRNVALTGPYMHDGRYATLRDVVRHYSEIDEERLHADGERIVRPLRLSAAEIDDMVSFLETLTARGPAYARRPERSPCAGSSPSSSRTTAHERLALSPRAPVTTLSALRRW